MADRLFMENPPSRQINIFLRQNMKEYLSQTDNPAHLSDISRFYSELEAAVATIEGKYITSRTRELREIQQLVQSQGMVLRTLKKIHDKITRRLRSTPNLAKPWRDNFTIDVPREVFNVILCHIIQNNNIGHEFNETSVYIEITITELREAVLIFDFMNLDGVLISRDDLLKKRFGSSRESLERCEVLVSQAKPLTLKYHKNTEVLSVHFDYGCWNQFGIAQH